MGLLNNNWKSVNITSITRSSAIADKPRDAFVQYATAWLLLLNTLLHYMFYHANFGRCVSNTVETSKGSKNLEELTPLRWGRGWSLQTRPSHMGYPAEFVCCWSNGTSVRVKIRRKTGGKPHIPPFKVTQGHRNWHGLIGYLPTTSY